MADITESAVIAGLPVDLSSLASFRALSMQGAPAVDADTGDIARVAAELLTDARQVRGLHGDAIVVAPSGSAEHELHVNLHACERAALAAQRRGVEALTAKLRNDDALLATIRTSAFADLESAAQSLLSAASLSDQLRSTEAADGPPPPPVPDSAGVADGEVVLDLTGETADLGYRSTDLPTLADLAFGDSSGGGWEDRRAAILDRVDQVRRPNPERSDDELDLGAAVPDPTDSADVADSADPADVAQPVDDDAERSTPADPAGGSVSPIIAAALSKPALRSEEPPVLPDDPVESPDPTVDVAPAVDPVVDDVATAAPTEDHEPDAPVLPLNPTPVVDEDPTVDATEDPTVDVMEDAVVIDIGDAPSAAAAGTETSGLADVIELQTEATVHEWPVWQGPARERGEAQVQEVVVPADLDGPLAAPAVDDAVSTGEDGYPRLVSVAPDPTITPPTEPKPIVGDEPARRTFSFAPEPPASDLLPVPFSEPSDRKSQEEIAAEARALIAVQQRIEAANTFSPKEARRRQRQLRGHQRAVEKAESRVQRDRRRAELEHERSLANQETAATSYSPTWFSQLAFAIAICVLVVMVAVGLWFLLAEDPGLF